MPRTFSGQYYSTDPDLSPTARAGLEEITRHLTCALTPLDTANKNRVLLALQAEITATLEALETITHD
jgi:hypothetical protein